MNHVATFEKVSFEQYARNMCFGLPPEQCDKETLAQLREGWEALPLPKRATDGSAGYDFYLPHKLTMVAGIPMVIPTYVRVKLDPCWVLLLLPRSGLGFKYGMRMMNTAGVIDSDYYNADNEGHIMAKVLTDCNMTLERGDRFMQGLILPFGTATNDEGAEFAHRTGGMGSTGV